VVDSSYLGALDLPSMHDHEALISWLDLVSNQSSWGVLRNALNIGSRDPFGNMG
jgi:hypothetical protein